MARSGSFSFFEGLSILGKENPDGTLPFNFEYDILDNNELPRESFGEDFFEIIGDILVDIIDKEELEKHESNN